MTDHNGVLMMQRALLAGTLGLAMAQRAAAILEGEPGDPQADRSAQGAVLQHLGVRHGHTHRRRRLLHRRALDARRVLTADRGNGSPNSQKYPNVNHKDFAAYRTLPSPSRHVRVPLGEHD